MAMMLRALTVLAITAGPPGGSPPRPDVLAIDRGRVGNTANAALPPGPGAGTPPSSPPRPSRKVEIVVEAVDGSLTYRVTLAGQPVVEPSPLGLLLNGVDLGRDARLDRVDRYSTNERYPWRGVRSEAVDRSRGARLHLTH